jgi:hypothetical protein
MNDVADVAATSKDPTGDDDYFGDICLDGHFHDEKLDDNGNVNDGRTSAEQEESNDVGMTTAGSGKRITRRRYWLAGGLVLFLVVIISVVLGVTLPQQNRNSSSQESASSGAGDESNDTVETSPSQPSIAPVEGPPQPPSTAATPPMEGGPGGGDANLPSPTYPPLDPENMSRAEYFAALAQQWSDAEALEDTQSAASQALDWLLNTDPMQLTNRNAVLDIQQRYVAAVLWYATVGQFWGSDGRRRGRRLRNASDTTSLSSDTTTTAPIGDDRELQADSNSTNNVANFLSGLDVCFWKTPDELHGLVCDDTGLIRELHFGM